MTAVGRIWADAARCRIREDAPHLASHADALFLPGAEGGVFDRDGRLIVEATSFRPDGEPAGGSWRVDPRRHEGADAAPTIPHVHAGPAPATMAELLFRTLPHHWSRATRHGEAAKLLFGGGEDALDRTFLDDHLRAAFAALGIARSDCVSYGHPTRIGVLVSPAPAFEAAALTAHRTDQRTILRLADRLAGPARTAVDEGLAPLHVSAGSTGDRDLRAELERTLRAAGTRVVDPATLSLAALVREIRGACVVSAVATPGGAEAALTRFASGEASVIVLRTDDGDTSKAVADATTLAAVLAGRRGGIIDMRGASPAASAAALANAIRHAESARHLTFGSAAWSHPGGGAPEDLLDGMLTGQARMRTGQGQRPWWEVDLGRTALVEAVRVHGPLSGADRPRQVRLLASRDRRSWTEIARRRDEAPIGSGLGSEAAWDVSVAPPQDARFLRIQEMETGVLTLDQVEIRTR